MKSLESWDVEVTYTESARVMFGVTCELDGVSRNDGATGCNWEECVLECCLGRTELGDVLLELETMATVFYEEASIPLICNLHLLGHGIVLNL